MKKFITLLLVIGVLLVPGYFFHKDILSIFNGIFPTKNTSAYLLDDSWSDVQSYSGTREVFVKKEYVLEDKFISVDESKVVVKNQELATTTVDLNSLDFTLIKLEGKKYGLDAYDETIHLAQDGQEKDLPLSIILDINLFNILEKTREIDSVKKKDDSLLFKYKKVEIGDLYIENLTIVVDKKNYQPTSFDLSGYYKDQEVKIKSKLNQHNLTEPNLSGYTEALGDYVARESLLIRTNVRGEYDHLWNKWEEEFFGCNKCVNLMGDNDGDSIKNILEFIFNTNPVQKSVNEYDSLVMGRHPITDRELDQSYYKSVSAFLEEYALQGVSVSKQNNEILGYKVRSPILQLEIRNPLDVTKFTFKYTAYDEDSYTGYVTVFFDNKLIYTIKPKGDEENQEVSIPISEEYFGKNFNVTFILNSVGVSGSYVDIMFENLGTEDGVPGAVLVP